MFTVCDGVYWLHCEVANGVIWKVEMFMYVGSFMLINISTVIFILVFSFVFVQPTYFFFKFSASDEVDDVGG